MDCASSTPRAASCASALRLSICTKWTSSCWTSVKPSWRPGLGCKARFRAAVTSLVEAVSYISCRKRTLASVPRAGRLNEKAAVTVLEAFEGALPATHLTLRLAACSHRGRYHTDRQPFTLQNIARCPPPEKPPRSATAGGAVAHRPAHGDQARPPLVPGRAPL